MKPYLHIICHDVPYPMDYGGVIDLFCKLEALQKAGIAILLHCFEYGRGRQPALNKYCEAVYYYTRNEGHKGFSVKYPYIVCSRSSETLTNDLLKDDYPILMEGIHCSYITNDDRFKNRKMLLRLQNVECSYYRQLFKHANTFFRKTYYYNESRLLKKYERKLAQKIPVLALSEKDAGIYRSKMHAKKIGYCPVFIPWTDVKSPEGLGTYCLYHGNLSVNENEEAALWLIKNVFNDLKLPFVIAGKNPSAKLEKTASQFENVCLLANPAEDEIRDLIAKAQINILPSFNETGIKLKLINALFNGRHCLVNEAAVDQTGLEPATHIGSNAVTFKHQVIELYHLPFTREDINIRRKILLDTYNNKTNAQTLIGWIW